MAVRDRTQELLRAQGGGGSAARAEGERQPQGADAALRDVLAEVERVHGWIAEVRGGTDAVRRLHATPTFHTDAKLHEEVEAAVSLSAGAAAKVCGALRQLAAAGSAGSAGGVGGAAGRAARLHAAAAARMYSAALHDHHAVLQLLRDDRRTLLRATARLANLDVTEEECEALLDTDNVALFVENLQAETASARLALRDLETRRDELLRLEASLQEMHKLFIELAFLVDSQQEQLDSVEYYALQASEHVGAGHQQLLKGSVSRRKGRQKKLSIIICLASGLLLVLLVLIFT